MAAIEVLEGCKCSHDSPYPFGNQAREGQPYVSIKKSFATLMARAELGGVTAHVMRHTAASLMINGGHSLYSVSRILRHASVTTSARYAHLQTHTLQNATDTISEQLLRAVSGEK
jgi:site-specific recombinase XerD